MNTGADARCKAMYRKLFPGLTSRPVVVMDDLFNVSKTPVCFDKLLVGAADLGDDCQQGGNGILSIAKARPSHCNQGKAKLLWDFRSYVKRNFGVPEVLPAGQHIIIWHRTIAGNHNAGYLDAPAAGEHLRYRFPGVKVTVVEFATMPVAEQIRLIGDATVHITEPGGGSFIGVWLPRHATHIRCSSPGGYGMDHQLFNCKSCLVEHTTPRSVPLPLSLGEHGWCRAPVSTDPRCASNIL